MSSNWGWKMSTDPDDVMNFLNGKNGYKDPVKNFKVCSLWKGSYPEFYVFYTPSEGGYHSKEWGWKKSTDPDDVMNFLNGKDGYKYPVKEARVCVIRRDTYEEFYIFYKD